MGKTRFEELGEKLDGLNVSKQSLVQLIASLDLELKEGVLAGKDTAKISKSLTDAREKLAQVDYEIGVFTAELPKHEKEHLQAKLEELSPRRQAAHEKLSKLNRDFEMVEAAFKERQKQYYNDRMDIDCELQVIESQAQPLKERLNEIGRREYYAEVEASAHIWS
jgi:chromosome segregation ATPase